MISGSGHKKGAIALVDYLSTFATAPYKTSNLTPTDSSASSRYTFRYTVRPNPLSGRFRLPSERPLPFPHTTAGHGSAQFPLMPSN